MSNPTTILVCLLLLILTMTSASLSIVNDERSSTITYRYFAFGSNMVLETMESLRGLRPLDATAAVLPDYKLRFNIPGVPRIEPSAANVERCKGETVHGVLYTLTEQDFATVGRTEGVPFSYKWQSCKVLPYRGNGVDAGLVSINSINSDDDNNDQRFVKSFTLTASNPRLGPDIPPSKSYRDLLIQGAMDWKLDKSHFERLQRTPYAKDLLFKEGLARTALDVADLQRRFFRNR